MVRIEGIIVGHAVGELDVDRGIARLHQFEIHQQTPGSAVAVTKCNKRKTLYLQDNCSYRVSVCSVYHLGEGNIKSQLKIICISSSVMVITLINSFAMVFFFSKEYKPHLSMQS